MSVGCFSLRRPLMGAITTAMLLPGSGSRLVALRSVIRMFCFESTWGVDVMSWDMRVGIGSLGMVRELRIRGWRRGFHRWFRIPIVCLRLRLFLCVWLVRNQGLPLRIFLLYRRIVGMICTQKKNRRTLPGEYSAGFGRMDSCRTKRGYISTRGL